VDSLAHGSYITFVGGFFGPRKLSLVTFMAHIN
jgi:hypothetical protein